MKKLMNVLFFVAGVAQAAQSSVGTSVDPVATGSVTPVVAASASAAWQNALAQVGQSAQVQYSKATSAVIAGYTATAQAVSSGANSVCSNVAAVYQVAVTKSSQCAKNTQALVVAHPVASAAVVAGAVVATVAAVKLYKYYQAQVADAQQELDELLENAF